MLLEPHQPLAAWAVGLAITLTLAGALLLMRGYQARRVIIDARQLRLRLLGCLVLLALELLVGAMLLGIDPRTEPRLFLAAFAATFLLTIALAVIALLDLRLLQVNELRHRLALARELAELQRQASPAADEP